MYIYILVYTCQIRLTGLCTWGRRILYILYTYIGNNIRLSQYIIVRQILYIHRHQATVIVIIWLLLYTMTTASRIRTVDTRKRRRNVILTSAAIDRGCGNIHTTKFISMFIILFHLSFTVSQQISYFSRDVVGQIRIKYFQLT